MATAMANRRWTCLNFGASSEQDAVKTAMQKLGGVYGISFGEIVDGREEFTWSGSTMSWYPADSDWSEVSWEQL
jgi:hypothetical protein